MTCARFVRPLLGPVRPAPVRCAECKTARTAALHLRLPNPRSRHRAVLPVPPRLRASPASLCGVLSLSVLHCHWLSTAAHPPQLLQVIIFERECRSHLCSLRYQCFLQLVTLMGRARMQVASGAAQVPATSATAKQDLQARRGRQAGQLLEVFNRWRQIGQVSLRQPCLHFGLNWHGWLATGGRVLNVRGVHDHLHVSTRVLFSRSSCWALPCHDAFSASWQACGVRISGLLSTLGMLRPCGWWTGWWVGCSVGAGEVCDGADWSMGSR